MTDSADRTHHARVSALLLEALALEQDRREAFLQEKVGAEPQLLREVSELLEQSEADGDFLSTPALGSDFKVPPPEQVEQAPLPRHLAGYRIMGRLGAGAMGVVYHATGGEPEQEVALKLLRPGMADAEAIARFTREAQLLGKLDHPGIARVFSAGATDEGAGPQPWLAMELVRGSDLLEYAESQELEQSARVELMASVCDAVEHAHQRGVVHRDLKPGNVSVDEAGQPHVLDFGVACSLDEELDRTTLLTRPGELLGTLPYMSPEQASCDGKAVGARSDIYSLGAMLYELLTGRRPHDLAGLTLPEAVRVVAEADPPPLAAVDTELRGDLDLIVQTAMQHDPTRRYEHAADLAADLRRHLRGEAVSARPPSPSEQLGRLLRSHRKLVAMFAAAALALFALSGGLAFGWLHALAAKAEAEAESARREQVTDYMISMMGGFQGDPTITVRETLEAAVSEVDEVFANDRLTLGMLHHELGKAFHQLGDYERAEDQIRRAHAVMRDHLGADDPTTLEVSGDIGALLSRQGRFAEAVEHLEGSWRDHVRVLGARHPLTISCRGDLVLACTKAGLHEKAEEHARANLEMGAEVFGEDDPRTVMSLMHLANSVWTRGEDESALALLERAWTRCKEVLGADDWQTLDQGNTLAIALLDTDPERAQELMQEVLERRRETLAPGHPSTLQSMNNVAFLHLRQERYDEAEELFRQAFSQQEQSLGLQNLDTLTSLGNLGHCLKLAGRHEEAETCMREAVLEASKLYPDGHYRLGTLHRNLGRLLADLGRHAEAEPEMLAAQRIISATFPEGHQRVRSQQLLMRDFYEGWGRHDEANRWDPDR